MLAAIKKRANFNWRKKKGTDEEVTETDWAQLYGVAVHHLGLAPSEVREMTVGEIYAIIDTKVDAKKGATPDYEELYQDLMEARNGC